MPHDPNHRTGAPGGRAATAAPSDLSDLPIDGPSLEALYRDGEAPGSYVGVYRGRLLPGWAPPALVELVPWQGKRLAAEVGYNRLRLVGERFPFEVRRGVSTLDERPCLIFDYARGGNPPVVRRIVDELRQIGPKLYLGPGMLRVGRDLRVWTWFALTPAT